MSEHYCINNVWPYGVMRRPRAIGRAIGGDEGSEYCEMFSVWHGGCAQRSDRGGWRHPTFFCFPTAFGGEPGQVGRGDHVHAGMGEGDGHGRSGLGRDRPREVRDEVGTEPEPCCTKTAGKKMKKNRKHRSGTTPACMHQPTSDKHGH